MDAGRVHLYDYTISTVKGLPEVVSLEALFATVCYQCFIDTLLLQT